MALDGFFFGRHTIRTTDAQTGETTRIESKRYKGISPEGVELAQERSKEIVAMIDAAPANAVVFIGGASEEERTKSTAEVFGNSIAEHYAVSPDVVILTRRQIDNIRDVAATDTRRFIREFLQRHSDKKIVITYPLFLKEFSLRPDFREIRTGESTEYNKALFPKGRTEDEATAVFMGSGGVAEKDGKQVEGIWPQEVALKQMRGLRRLGEFANRFAKDRPVVLGYISHGWLLDAVAGYLANGGKSNLEAFDKIGGTMIQSSELGKVEVKDGKVTFTYRDKAYTVPPALLNG